MTGTYDDADRALDEAIDETTDQATDQPSDQPLTDLMKPLAAEHPTTGQTTVCAMSSGAPEERRREGANLDRLELSFFSCCISVL